jgi:hypothetical protein
MSTPVDPASAVEPAASAASATAKSMNFLIS